MFKTALITSSHNLRDLLAKEFGAPGGGMTDAVSRDIQLLKLRRSHLTESHDMVARKQIEKSLQHR
jgi:hypothetical protein